MPELSDYELLQLIYKHINLDALKSQNNSITRECVDNLFSKLLEYIKRGKESTSPPPTHSPSPLSSPPRGEGW
ncbi:MAG TPA: hypothetical protein VI387_04565, partial [Candidatus Brocadiales bacterium]|nr:hypothetical protein [Candidatus Brocadiales bacterium]